MKGASSSRVCTAFDGVVPLIMTLVEVVKLGSESSCPDETQAGHRKGLLSAAKERALESPR